MPRWLLLFVLLCLAAPAGADAPPPPAEETPVSFRLVERSTFTVRVPAMTGELTGTAESGEAVRLVFANANDPSFKNCTQYFSQGVPLRHVLFISGVGSRDPEGGFRITAITGCKIQPAS